MITVAQPIQLAQINPDGTLDVPNVVIEKAKKIEAVQDFVRGVFASLTTSKTLSEQKVQMAAKLGMSVAEMDSISAINSPLQHFGKGGL